MKDIKIYIKIENTQNNLNENEKKKWKEKMLTVE